ncbi:COP9 signalosome complex subunit 6a-like [Olea europaea subsp. europaea]|uniref:COP9 signalosome complex subunit 6 n=1 Tax=Olea europaea subsp. europaea TaxID=158383 RepID=A0A8S0TVC6_OLEEU|nr:COP9 signalosome complex subunit 6a-like [Olea europaea subsp. europaea]
MLKPFPSIFRQITEAAKGLGLEENMASSSSSGLTFKLHPLVIVNISDHYTRIKSQSLPPPSTPHAASASNGATSDSSSPPPQPPPRVFGCVIGVQRGRTVEIFNSFELLYDPSTHSLDRAFLEKKQELYKKVFPNFYILGWYSTGSDAQESDMQIHRDLMDINESPLYVLLNPSINPAQKDLPVTIYESELHVIDGIPQLIFVQSSYTIELKLNESPSIMLPILNHLTGVQLQLNWLLTLQAYTVPLRCLIAESEYFIIIFLQCRKVIFLVRIHC